MHMGHSVEIPTVKLSLTKEGATRLHETLVKNRDVLNGITDPVGKAQRDFLDGLIATLQSGMRAAGFEAKSAKTG